LPGQPARSVLRGGRGGNVVPLPDTEGTIKKAEEVVRPAAEAKGISLDTRLDRNVGQITGDPDRLQQAVWNLLSNAIKFTKEGGRVEVKLERVGLYVQITVSDTGQGIKPEFLPYMFDRHRQADAFGGRRAGGLGLGLTLVRQLVEMHGGSVAALIGCRVCMLPHTFGGRMEKDWICSFTWHSKNLTNWI
jgi:signal transduction histidine kinase